MLKQLNLVPFESDPISCFGKPCAGKLHARFDEGGLLKGCFLLYPSLVCVPTMVNSGCSRLGRLLQ